MKLKKSLLAFAVATAWAGSAHAGIIVNNWTIDTTVAAVEGGTLDRVIADVDEITYRAIIDTRLTTDAGTAGFPDVGDVYSVVVYGFATGFTNVVAPPATLGSLTPFELNQTIELAGFTPWELTFSLVSDYQVVGVLGDDVDFSQLGGGTLNIYIDDILGGLGKADFATASTFTDGTNIATFTGVSAGGVGTGNLDATDLNGDDNSVFAMSAANALLGVAGVFTKGTYDFATTEGADIHTQGDYDADQDGDGLFNTSYGALDCAAVQGPGRFCADEDGSAQLSVPEPGTLALLGLGLMGLASVGRRQRK